MSCHNKFMPDRFSCLTFIRNRQTSILTDVISQGFELRKIARSARYRSSQALVSSELPSLSSGHIVSMEGHSSSIEVGLKGRNAQDREQGQGRLRVPVRRSIENVLASLDQCSFSALQTVEPGKYIQ